MKRLIALLTVLVLLLSGCAKEEKFMALEFDESAEQGVEWPDISNIPSWPGSLPLKTNIVWIHMTNLGAQESVVVECQGDLVDDQRWSLMINAAGDVRWNEGFSVASLWGGTIDTQ